MQITNLTSEELFQELVWIPETLSKKYFRYQNYNDILQFGYYALWRAVLKFDWDKGRNPKAYVYPWVRKEIAKVALEEKLYLEQHFLVGESRGYESKLEFSLESLINKIEDKLIIKNILKKLDRDNKQVVDLYFGISSENLSLRSIGSRLGFSHEKVRKIKSQALRVIKAYYCSWN